MICELRPISDNVQFWFLIIEQWYCENSCVPPSGVQVRQNGAHSYGWYRISVSDGKGWSSSKQRRSVCRWFRVWNMNEGPRGSLTPFSITDILNHRHGVPNSHSRMSSIWEHGHGYLPTYLSSHTFIHGASPFQSYASCSSFGSCSQQAVALSPTRFEERKVDDKPDGTNESLKDQSKFVLMYCKKNTSCGDTCACTKCLW